MSDLMTVPACADGAARRFVRPAVRASSMERRGRECGEANEAGPPVTAGAVFVRGDA